MASMMLLSRLNRKSLELYIPELIVQKDHQSKGIGKEIMKFCIDFAKQQKCHRIRLESGNQRTSSHQFYKKLGFEQSSLSFTKNLE
jgi:GNAT superfamily N-acetyltransferase